MAEKMEVLHRGKCKFGGKWVEGFYLLTEDNTDPVIIDITCKSHAIDPDTRGAYIGISDKEGQKIFEGDIVRQYWKRDNPEAFITGVVEYDNTRCKFIFRNIELNQDVEFHADWRYEVIGNIYEPSVKAQSDRFKYYLYQNYATEDQIHAKEVAEKLSMDVLDVLRYLEIYTLEGAVSESVGVFCPRCQSLVTEKPTLSSIPKLVTCKACSNSETFKIADAAKHARIIYRMI